MSTVEIRVIEVGDSLYFTIPHKQGKQPMVISLSGDATTEQKIETMRNMFMAGVTYQKGECSE